MNARTENSGVSRRETMTERSASSGMPKTSDGRATPEEGFPPVLMLHGVCSTGATMNILAEPFRNHGYSVSTPTLAMERRTDVGSLDGSLSRLSLSAMLDEARCRARAIAREFGEKPVVVGHSNGALLALSLAGLEETAGIALIAPAPPASVPGAPPWIRRLQFSRVFGRRWNSRAIRFRPKWPLQAEMPNVELAGTLCPDSGPAMAEVLAHSAGAPYDPWPPLRCPVIVVAGSKDRLVPVSLTRKLAKRFGAAHHTIEGAGHWLIGNTFYAEAACLAILDNQQHLQPVRDTSHG